MDWLSEHWLDVVGWGGSALLVYSLLQTRVMRFRTLNLLASAVLTAFNALIAVWPMAAMNFVLGAINVWFIAKLLRERHDAAAFDVLEVGTGDDYLRHVLRIHGEDILRFQPDFVWDADPARDHAFIVMRSDETVGVVILRREGDQARVLLDYVTPRYRDFTPGEFVWRRSGMLNGLGLRQVRTSPTMAGPYYDRVGFRPSGDQYVLDI